MPKIRDIMTSSDPDNLGLIPFMQKNLGGDWDRFQLRPWNFSTPGVTPQGQLRSDDQQSGFRWGLQKENGDESTSIYSWDIRAGYELTGVDQLELQISAAELSIRMQSVIKHWSICTQFVNKRIDKSVCGFSYAPNPTISSGNPLGWAIAVVREFEIEFDAESEFV